MNVASILAEKGSVVYTLSEGGSVMDAILRLREHKVGAMVVVDGDSSILGILSERDVVRAIAERGAASLSEKVSDLMTRDVVTCRKETSVSELMDQMTKGRFRHLPVVENGKLAGLISIGDVVKRRIAEVEQEAEHIKSYIAAG